MDLHAPTNIFDASRLESSVGRGGANKPLDVLVIQRLLLGTTEKFTGQLSLSPDGFNGPKTEGQIQSFQRQVLMDKLGSGRVVPGDVTHKKLIASVSSDFLARHRQAAAQNEKHLIDSVRFVALCSKQLATPGSLPDLKRLLEALCRDTAMTDLRWIAYALATVKRECGNTWRPIEEWGKGKGKEYGEAVEVTDPVTKSVTKQAYYGRGYVQLTWDYNYKKVGAALGMGNALYLNPSKVLEHDIAYKILSLGMRKGLFSRACLGQFISGSASHYVAARVIINGHDHAVEIAKDARLFETLLRASQCKGILQEIVFLFHRALAGEK